MTERPSAAWLEALREREKRSITMAMLFAEIDALRAERDALLSLAAEVAYDATVDALAAHSAGPHDEALPHKWDKTAACAVAGAVRAIAPRD